MWSAQHCVQHCAQHFRLLTPTLRPTFASNICAPTTASAQKCCSTFSVPAVFCRRLAPVDGLVDGAAAVAYHVRHPPLPVLFDVVGPVDGHEILDVGLHVEASVVQRPHIDRLASALRQEIRFGGRVLKSKQPTLMQPTLILQLSMTPERSGARYAVTSRCKSLEILTTPSTPLKPVA